MGSRVSNLHIFLNLFTKLRELPLRLPVESGCSTCLWYLYGRFVVFMLCYLHSTATRWRGARDVDVSRAQVCFYFYFTLLMIFLQIDYTYNNDHHHHSTLQPQQQIQEQMFLFYFFVFYTNYIYTNNDHFTGLTPTTYLICSIHIILEACHRRRQGTSSLDLL